MSSMLEARAECDSIQMRRIF